MTVVDVQVHRRSKGGELSGGGMVRIEQRLADMSLQLSDEIKLPGGVKTPFAWIRVRGNRAFISGHGGVDPV